MLIDPKNSCSSSRQWVALVVGHELAHQWFGNLVTMVKKKSYKLTPVTHTQNRKFCIPVKSVTNVVITKQKHELFYKLS